MTTASAATPTSVTNNASSELSDSDINTTTTTTDSGTNASMT